MDVGQPKEPDRWRPVTAAETGDDVSVLFEQYKIAIEMADRISARRGTANGFYFTVSSALLATSETLGLSIASIAGMALAGAWWLQLRSYRNLNAAKWAAIGSLEAHLPAHPFADEWSILKNDPLEHTIMRSRWLGDALRPLSRYAELSIVEQVVPAIYLGLFVASLIHALS